MNIKFDIIGLESLNDIYADSSVSHHEALALSIDDTNRLNFNVEEIKNNLKNLDKNGILTVSSTMKGAGLNSFIVNYEFGGFNSNVYSFSSNEAERQYILNQVFDYWNNYDKNR